MGILKQTLVLILLISQSTLTQASTSLESLVSFSDSKTFKESTTKPYTLVYFWATWCPDCKKKLTGDLSEYQTTKVSMIAVATDKDEEKVKNYLSQNKVSIPVFQDIDKKLQKELKIFSVPSVALVTIENGKLKTIAQGNGRDFTEINKKIAEISK